MNIIDEIRSKSASLNRTVVFPEGNDIRTIKAASFIVKSRICKPIVLGKPDVIHRLAAESDVEIPEAIHILDYKEDTRREKYAQHLYERRKNKGLTREQASELMQNELYFATEMLAHGDADACVAGAVNTTGDVLRAAIHVVGLKPGSNVVSSTFLMSMPDGKIYTFGDCAVVPYPDAMQLASIAIDSAKTHQQLTGEKPKVAMLSFSTKGSAVHDSTNLVSEATELVRELAPDIDVDGELQFDAALLPDIANKKAPGSKVAGQANVFIFPNLDAGNIGYKITERLGKAIATGPIIQGLAAPMNDLSRGCSWEDIVNTAAVSALQSA